MDITYNSANLAMWSCIESAVGVLCACMPSTKLFIQRVLHKFRETNGSPSKPFFTTPEKMNMPKPLENLRETVNTATQLSDSGTLGSVTTTTHMEETCSRHGINVQPCAPNRLIVPNTTKKLKNSPYIFDAQEAPWWPKLEG
jgi:hypothetical protein